MSDRWKPGVIRMELVCAMMDRYQFRGPRSAAGVFTSEWNDSVSVGERRMIEIPSSVGTITSSFHSAA